MTKQHIPLPPPKIFALDWDETITADPVLWASFILMAKGQGHTVTIVTIRPPGMNNMEIEAFAFEHDVNIVCTSGNQKRSFFKADIWIDDAPELIPTAKELELTLTGCKKIGE